MGVTVRALTVGLVGWLMFGTAAQAAEPLLKQDAIPGTFSANVALTSEYVFRGISQTDARPAVQGGFDYEVNLADKSMSFYTGVWGSNVHFADASIEVDVVAGLKGEIGPVGWSAGGVYYIYPGAAPELEYDFFEAAFSVSYDPGFASFTGALNYSPEYFGESGDAVYTAFDVEIPVGKFVALKGHVGYQDIEKEENFGTSDYLDYSLGVGVNLFGFDVDLAWTDTDLAKDECDEACGIVTFTVARSF